MQCVCGYIIKDAKDMKQHILSHEKAYAATIQYIFFGKSVANAN